MSAGNIHGQEETDYIVADSVLHQGDTAQIELNPGVRGTIQWQRSHETDSWEDIEGEKETELLQQITDTVFFRAKITEDNCEPIYSEAVRIDIGIAPTADFTSDTANIAEEETINFEDLSTDNPETWGWNFGDGNTSSAQNPSHTYSTEGTYTVELAVSNDYGSDTLTKTDYITVGSAPKADFTSATANITEGETINFEDISDGDPDTWQWDFGDGNTSNQQNPSHVYSSGGSYTVELVVSNEYGEDTATKTDYIAVCPESFTDGRDGQIYEAVQIGDQCWMAENLNYDQEAYGNDGCYDNDESNCDTYGRLYDWEAVMQGDTSSSSNPSGVQGVCPNGWHVPSDEEWKELEMELGMSQSEANGTDFRGTNEGSKLAANASLWVDGNLGNNSEFGASGFSALPGGIRLGSGGFLGIGEYAPWWSSTENSSTNVWSRELHYDYSGVARNDGGEKDYGSLVRCVRDSITTSSPTAGFRADTTTIQVGDTINFTNQSTGSPTSWSWNFGDGDTSTKQNPSHTYATEGTYTIKLTVSNEYGSDILTKTDYIIVGSVPKADFTADQTTITVGESVQFTDESTNDPTSWSWKFGDGNTSNQQNLSHTYSSADTYTVELTVSNDKGSDTETKTNYITVIECPTTFTDNRNGQTYNAVLVGNQCWMAENLNYAQHDNGNSWCYENDESNCDTYGRLYDWVAVMQGENSSNSNPSGVQGVCPDGWHVPSDEEWKELEMELGMSQSEADDVNERGWNEGSKLAGNDSLWADGNLKENSEFGSSGFIALPGGRPYEDGTFGYLGSYGYWWSSTEYSSTGGWSRSLGYEGSDVFRDDFDKEYGLSVRCIRDD